MNEYASFVTEMESGVHGPTAQFWMEYIQMIRLYHELTRSLRTGDLELYIQCLPKITNYFFSLNHPNYARWLVRYEDNLQVERDSPWSICWIQRRLLFIKKNRNILFQITYRSNVRADNKRQRSLLEERYCSTYQLNLSPTTLGTKPFLRTTIVSQVFQDLGLSQKEDISQDLKPSRIKQNSRDLNQIISLINDTMNPFSDEINE